MALQLISCSPFVRMTPFSSTASFSSQFSLRTWTRRRLRRTMAAFPATQTLHVWVPDIWLRVSSAPVKRSKNVCLRRTGCRTFSTFDDLGDLRLVGVEFKRCQEAQRAQVKGHHWWNAVLRAEGEDCCFSRKHKKTIFFMWELFDEYLKEWRCIQQRSISTETNDEVHTVREVVKIWKTSPALATFLFIFKRWVIGIFYTFSESAKLLSNGSKVLVPCNGRVIQNFLLHIDDHVFHLQRHTRGHQLDWRKRKLLPNRLQVPAKVNRTSVRKMQSSLKGCSRLASRIFLMTRTLLGGLFHVSLWLAGSWMCLKK